MEPISEEREAKLRKGSKMFARDFTGVMKELAEEEDPTSSQEKI